MVPILQREPGKFLENFLSVCVVAYAQRSLVERSQLKSSSHHLPIKEFLSPSISNSDSDLPSLKGFSWRTPQTVVPLLEILQ